ncbi:MAG: hypothetical protein ABSC94_12855 [Polyangiaceae bacterium]|jgi:hypothetical protein
MKRRTAALLFVPIATGTACADVVGLTSLPLPIEGDAGLVDVGNSDVAADDGSAGVNDGSPDIDDGGPEPNDGSADANDNSTEPDDGSANDGSADANDGSADANDGSADANDGSADANDGSADANDGSADANDGSADANDGSPPDVIDDCCNQDATGGPELDATVQGSWVQFDSGAAPTVAYNFTPTLEINVVTLAPFWLNANDNASFYLYVLTSAQDAAGDYQLQAYSSEGTAGSWTSHANEYYEGIVTYDATDEFYVGWAGDGTLWKNDTNVAVGVTSFANAGSTALGNPWGLCTSNHHGCMGDQPGGWCVYAAVSSALNVWTAMPSTGAEQVTVDTITGSTFYLDLNGRVWGNVALTNLLCDGGTVTFTQIAAKNGFAYGLSSGNVFKDLGACWTDLAAPVGTSFRSIATDNSAQPYETVTQVWASDQVGTIWIFE